MTLTFLQIKKNNEEGFLVLRTILSLFSLFLLFSSIAIIITMILIRAPEYRKNVLHEITGRNDSSSRWMHER